MGLTQLGDGDLSMAVECYMRGGMTEPDARRTAARDVRDLHEGWAQYRRLRDGTIDPPSPLKGLGDLGWMEPTSRERDGTIAPDTLPTREREPGEDG